MNPTNLIFNPSGEFGTAGWSGCTFENGILKSTGGSIYNSNMIPIREEDTYKLEFDIKFTPVKDQYWYVAIFPYDTHKQFINHSDVVYLTNTTTTLASDLTAGATSVTLTSAANWSAGTAASHMRNIGICNLPAYGYKKASKTLVYTAVSGNTLTLASAYKGDTIPAGTKVANFYGGGTYYYPWSRRIVSTDTDWIHVNVSWKGKNTRSCTTYMTFNTLGYGSSYYSYEIKNLSLVNTTSYQHIDYPNNLKIDVNKAGTLTADYSESGRLIRYIKDTTNGSTANGGNHWIEIQAFNNMDYNIALDKKSSNDNGATWVKNRMTDGDTDFNNWNYPGLCDGVNNRIIDLEFITRIDYLKIWHYWGDGRTYHDHKVYVSEDGTNWDLVYSGERPETSAGLRVDLYPKEATMSKSGIFYAPHFYED